MVVVVKKPGVDVAFAQRGLNGWEVHGQMTILNKGSFLRERGLEAGPAQGRWDGCQSASRRPQAAAGGLVCLIMSLS